MSMDSFKTRRSLAVGGESFDYYSLPALEQSGFPGVGRLPFSLKILLENLIRREDNAFVRADDIRALAEGTRRDAEISFMPARVLLQDFTGVPCVVDLAAMRDGIVQLGGDPERVNPLQPVVTNVVSLTSAEYTRGHRIELTTAAGCSFDVELRAQ